MLLAHLRGLLLPYYDQGFRSVLAERVVLQAMAAEIRADYESRFLMMQAGFAPLAGGKNAQSLFADMSGGFSGIVDRAMLDFSRTPERVYRNAKGLMALYDQLMESGFFDQLNEATETVLRDHPMRRK